VVVEIGIDVRWPGTIGVAAFPGSLSGPGWERAIQCDTPAGNVVEFVDQFPGSIITPRHARVFCHLRNLSNLRTPPELQNERSKTKQDIGQNKMKHAPSNGNRSPPDEAGPAQFPAFFRNRAQCCVEHRNKSTREIALTPGL
jgi:hypothetical protein